ncbi:MAG: CAP domain-containing protein, partial [Nitrososphaera sp.]
FTYTATSSGSFSTRASAIDAKGAGAQDAQAGGIAKITTEVLAPAKIDLAKTAKLIHQKINEQRAKYGLAALSWDPALATIAADHSKDMAKRNYFSHNDLEGHRYTYRYSSAGYVCKQASGENIYKYSSTRTITEEYLASKAVSAWMDSSGHRHNILSKSFHNEGVGVAFDSAKSYYVTQDFCALHAVR